MNDNRGDNLDDLMDRYVFGLLDAPTEGRVRRRIEDDPEWQLAYEAAVRRKQALAAGVKRRAAQAAATRAPEAAEILAAGRALERRRRTRRRIAAAALGSLAAAAVVLIGVFWLRAAAIRPPARAVRLLGQTSLLAGSRGVFRVVVTDANGRTPLPGVPVRLLASNPLLPAAEPLLLAAWNTGRDGAAGGPVAVPDWPEGNYQLAAVAGDDRPVRVTVPIRLRRDHRILLATDKPMYQPGQTVHMRCLVLAEPARKPAAGREVAFSVTDPHGNLIFSHPARLSDHGIASADLPTDALITPGRYQVRLDAGRSAAERTVEIHHYTLPAFAVKPKLDEPWYLPGQTVRGSVEVRYHFGKSAADAEVEFRLIDRTLPTHYLLAKRTVRTDKKGRARFELKLPTKVIGLARTSGDAQLLLAARAVDSAAQEHTAYAPLVVARQAIRIAAVAENGAAADGLETRLFVVTSYPDGRPAEATVHIGGLAVSAQTDAAGVAVFAAERFPAQLRISARDRRGRTGKAHLPLPKAGRNALVLRTDKPVYTAGETAAVEVLAAEPVEIHLDLIKDRQVYLTRTAQTDAAGRAQFALDLPADLPGTLRLHAYRLTDEGEWLGRDVLIIVRPASRLRVAVESDEPTYRPGQDARVTFTVTDAKGKAAPAALSLAAVDEAVYSVQQAAVGLEATLTGLEEELLRPAIQAVGLSPDLVPRSKQYAAAALAAAVAPGEKPAAQTPAKALHSLDADSRQQEWSAYHRRRSGAYGLASRAAWAGSIVAAAAVAVMAVVLLWPTLGELARRAAGAEFPWAALALAVIIAGILACLFVPYLAMARPAARDLDGQTVTLDETAIGRVPDAAGMDRSGGGPSEGSVPLIAPRDTGLADSTRPDEDVVPSAPPGPGEPVVVAPVRLRSYFPETMLWRPEVITDDAGRAVLNVPLADSITTWRLFGQAVDRRGRLGTVGSSLHVFQPFFVDVGAPVALTQGDEVTVPLIVYNYTRNVLNVSLQAGASAGLTVLGEARRTLALRAGQVRRAAVRVRADSAGASLLRVRASGGAVADAIEKPIRIVPPGLERFVAVNGEVAGPEQFAELTIPPEAIAGSVSAWMKVYPSRLGELLDGLDSIFRMPHGCFEQTSSTTYPNVMALQYLEAHKLGAAELRAKARLYIHRGYQRLLTFEVDGGGFDWYGRAPAKLAVTAYGLLEFNDMAKVHRIDPRLRKRTAEWLARQQKPTGAWHPEPGGFCAPFTGGYTGALPVTAYVTWAMAAYDADHAATRRAAGFLAEFADKAQDPHTLALCANALLTVDARSPAGLAAARRLAAMAQPGGKAQRHWPAQLGPTGEVATTALAALALMRAGGHRPLVDQALRWIGTRRDPHGTWGTTQATVLALKAMIRGPARPTKRSSPARFSVAAIGSVPGGEAPLGSLVIPPEQSDAVRVVRLDGLTRPGSYRLRLRATQARGMAYQFVARYHSPADEPPPDGPGLHLRVAYDHTRMNVDETVQVRAVVTNRTARTMNMLLVDVGTPPGFVVRREWLDRLQTDGRIERYSLRPRGIIVYLRSLRPGQMMDVHYEIVAKMPLRAVAPPTRVYAYYEPERAAATRAVKFHVD